MEDKYPEIPAERVAEYKEIYEKREWYDEVPEEVADYYRYLESTGTQQVSILNSERLGSFGAPYSNDPENADIAIIGLPLELSTPSLTGTRYGPQAIRRASKWAQAGSTHHDGTAPFGMCRIIDWGDIDFLAVDLFALAPSIDYLQQELRHPIIECGVAPLCWGGEHTATYATLKALAERHGPLSVVHIDQHLDAMTAADHPGAGVWDASLLSLAFSEGIVDPKRTISIGAYGRSRHFFQAGTLFGQTIVPPDEVWKVGAGEIGKRAAEIVADGPTFFTFDVDALSASECCSGGLPEGFGMTWRHIYEIIRALSDAGTVNLVGADLMEFTPMYPSGHRDGVMAAMVGWELLCWLARSVTARNGEWRPTRW